MSQTANATVLDSADPGSWSRLSSDALFSLPHGDVEQAQLEALQQRFETLRPRIEALDTLAGRQKVGRIGRFADAPAVFFDHRVYKSYPINLIEQRDFGRLTRWLQRLTTNDLSAADMTGVSSVDAWLVRLADSGMSVGHTTGTTGKLSFLPRSVLEWPNFRDSYFEMLRTLLGVDLRQEGLPAFMGSARRTHYWLGVRLGQLFREEMATTETHVLYDYEFSADLLSMAARLQSADARGQLDKIEIDPQLLEERKELIEKGQRRDEDLEKWLRLLERDYRGRRVYIQGVSADLVRVMLKGEELGIELDLAPDSLLFPGGGMKGYKDAPADWPERLMKFFSVDRMYSYYGMTESLGYAPGCEHGYYHFAPYTLPIILDEDFEALPREGVQTGRMALYDFLAESYWGGYITGDRVNIYWDSSCPCGRQGPRIDKEIVRFSDLDGGQDDKISCAGTTEAYSAFMDFVSEI